MYLHIDSTGAINATSVYLAASENILETNPVLCRRYVYTNVTSYEIAQKLANGLRERWEQQYGIGDSRL